MRIVRPVQENEVIAEFLKNEFYQEEFHRDRERFERIVLEADLSDERENRLRRALLFRRRGHMWRELPGDIAWKEVELEAEDLPLIRVFPRAHWRKIADGSLWLHDIVHALRTQPPKSGWSAVVPKICALRYRLQHEETQRSSVMLIGEGEGSPLTILEGNHRFAAAMLGNPEEVPKKLRVFCGFSPHMRQSCWYETNLANLWHYARNRVKHLFDRIDVLHDEELLPPLQLQRSAAISNLPGSSGSIGMLNPPSTKVEP